MNPCVIVLQYMDYFETVNMMSNLQGRDLCLWQG